MLKKIILNIDLDCEKLSVETLSFLADYLRTCVKYQLEKDENVLEQLKDIQEKVVLYLQESQDAPVAKREMKR